MRRRGEDLWTRAVTGALAVYKSTLSPLVGSVCRYAPSCSEYAAQALIAHGPMRGAALAGRRFCRCTPWGGYGYDPVPPAGAPEDGPGEPSKGGSRFKCV